MHRDPIHKQTRILMPVGASNPKVDPDRIRHVEAVRQTDYLESRIRPHIRVESGAGKEWRTRVIQLDSTGPATLEIALGEARIYAKLYADDRGALVYEKLRTLWASGFGAGERYQVVEPLGFIPEHAMLLTRAAEGIPVSAHIGVDDDTLAASAREAGLWLGHLHRSPLRVGKPQSLLQSAELLLLTKRLVKTVSRRPQLLEPALQMIGVLERLAKDTVEGILVQSHRQYRPMHVFVGDTSVTVIDLDRSRPCDPARDVAEFLHRLRMAMLVQTGTIERADGATDAFLASYREAVGDPFCPANLAFHWARYVFHSFNRKGKDPDQDEGELDVIVNLYRTELERVANGRFCPPARAGP